MGSPSSTLSSLFQTLPLLRDASASGNLTVLRRCSGRPGEAWCSTAKSAPTTQMPVAYQAHPDWQYLRDRPRWPACTGRQGRSGIPSRRLDWTTSVDPLSDEHPLSRGTSYRCTSSSSSPRATAASGLSSAAARPPGCRRSSSTANRARAFAACRHRGRAVARRQLAGATQVADEGRHVKVFHGYLSTKLEKRVRHQRQPYVVIDAPMSDFTPGTMKFLGMQIMIEGLALGAFGMIQKTREPLLKRLLTYRHHRRGEARCTTECSRWESSSPAVGPGAPGARGLAFEVSRSSAATFFAHEFDEYYGHAMTRASWETTGAALGDDVDVPAHHVQARHPQPEAHPELHEPSAPGTPAGAAGVRAWPGGSRSSPPRTPRDRAEARAPLGRRRLLRSTPAAKPIALRSTTRTASGPNKAPLSAHGGDTAGRWTRTSGTRAA